MRNLLIGTFKFNPCVKARKSIYEAHEMHEFKGLRFSFVLFVSFVVKDFALLV
jgi:hypothetical protein